MSHSLYLGNYEVTGRIYSQYSIHVGLRHMSVSGNHTRAKKGKVMQSKFTMSLKFLILHLKYNRRVLDFITC